MNDSVQLQILENNLMIKINLKNQPKLLHNLQYKTNWALKVCPYFAGELT